MRYRQLTTGTLALGVILLIDVLRVWLPGIITIFGQAASTPAELMGAFALGWFVLALGAPAVVRRVGARRSLSPPRSCSPPPGSRSPPPPAGVRSSGWPPPGCSPGWCGWSASPPTPTARSRRWRWGSRSTRPCTRCWTPSTWSGGATGWPGCSAPSRRRCSWPARRSHPSADRAQSSWSADTAGTGGTRAWLLAGPALLLSGMVALSPALARTGMSYLVAGDGVASSPLVGMAPVPVAVAGFLCAALTHPPGRWVRAYGPVALLAGAVLFALDQGDLLLPAILLAAVGLGGCLALTDDAGRPDDDTASASTANDSTSAGTAVDTASAGTAVDRTSTAVDARDRATRRVRGRRRHARLRARGGRLLLGL
ncbi:hypothetical protein NKG94_26060 [Micromonospora sp. M12]